MSLVVIDSGKRALLDFLTLYGGETISNARVHLYVNNQTPSHGDTLANYTEASWAGYAVQIALAWGGSVFDGFNRALTNAQVVTYSNTSGSPQSVYGYYVTSPLTGILLWAERFAGAPLTIPAGGFMNLIPQFTLTSEF